MSKNDGGLAFPIAVQMGNGTIATHHGMTLRDYLAAKAMQATVTNPDSVSVLSEMGAEEGSKVVARVAYMMADAMLAERAK